MKTEPMRTLAISLSSRQISRLHDAVESGSYASNSEVIRDALRLWEQREANRSIEILRLKQAYDDGMRSGAGSEIEIESFLAELKSEASAGE